MKKCMMGIGVACLLVSMIVVSGCKCCGSCGTKAACCGDDGKCCKAPAEAAK